MQGIYERVAHTVTGLRCGRLPGGKEGNRLEKGAVGEIIRPDEALTDYGDDGWQQLVVPIGRLMGIRRLARETGLDPVSSSTSSENGRYRARPLYS